MAAGENPKHWQGTTTLLSIMDYGHQAREFHLIAKMTRKKKCYFKEKQITKKGEFRNHSLHRLRISGHEIFLLL